MTMAHEMSQEDVMAFFDGELTGAQADEVGAHVRVCATCQAVGADVAAVSTTLAQWRVDPRPVSLVAPTRPVTASWRAPIAQIALVAAACVVAVVAGRFVHSRSAAPQEAARVEPDMGHVYRTAAQARTPTLLSSGDRAIFAASWVKQPRGRVTVQSGGPSVVVIAYMDWLCPACRTFDRVYEPVVRQYGRTSPGAVMYVVRDWPWDASCNPNLHGTIPRHEASCAAALAVRLARDRGQAEAMIGWLYDNLDEIGLMAAAAATDAIKDEVQRLLGIDDFDRAAAGVRRGLDQDIADGAAVNIVATPTFFINGVPATNRQNQSLAAEYFDAAIAIELERSKARGGGL